MINGTIPTWYARLKTFYKTDIIKLEIPRKRKILTLKDGG